MEKDGNTLMSSATPSAADVRACVLSNMNAFAETMGEDDLASSFLPTATETEATSKIKQWCRRNQSMSFLTSHFFH
jgi:hypothetical protein